MTAHRAMLLLAVLLAGCQSDQIAATPAESPLADQVAAVQSGRETWIVVEQQPLTDADLADLAGLSNLSTLCIDHPDSRISAAGIAHLAALPRLTHLRIRGPGLGDDEVAAIVKLHRLKIVNLPRGEFTDAGLARLQELPQLDFLRFGSPHVTDAGVARLRSFPSLQRLHLIDVPITDAGLTELAEIEQLQSLYIDGGNISDAAWDQLFLRRPKLHVHINQQHHDRDPNRHEHQSAAVGQ